jgi:hypothetical protein
MLLRRKTSLSPYIHALATIVAAAIGQFPWKAGGLAPGVFCVVPVAAAALLWEVVISPREGSKTCGRKQRLCTVEQAATTRVGETVYLPLASAETEYRHADAGAIS